MKKNEISVPETLEKYQVSRSTINRWVSKGWLHSKELPNGRILLLEEEVAQVFSIRTGPDTLVQQHNL